MEFLCEHFKKCTFNSDSLYSYKNENFNNNFYTENIHYKGMY